MGNDLTKFLQFLNEISTLYRERIKHFLNLKFAKYKATYNARPPVKIIYSRKLKNDVMLNNLCKSGSLLISSYLE